MCVRFGDIGNILDHHCLNFPFTSWTTVFSGVLVTQAVVICVVFYGSLFVFLAIVLSVLRFTTSDYPWDRRGRDRMVVGFTTTYAISAYHQWCYEFKSRSGRGIQHYVIKFVSDLRQVGGFLWVIRFPPPIKLTATI